MDLQSINVSCPDENEKLSLPHLRTGMPSSHVGRGRNGFHDNSLYLFASYQGYYPLFVRSNSDRNEQKSTVLLKQIRPE